MGQAKSQFSDEELQDYEDLTFFTKKEILLYVSICQCQSFKIIDLIAFEHWIHFFFVFNYYFQCP